MTKILKTYLNGKECGTVFFNYENRPNGILIEHATFKYIPNWPSTVEFINVNMLKNTTYKFNNFLDNLRKLH
jgi:hypothetical protein